MHRAIMRQGASIIDKQDIKTLRGHRVVVLTQGPDLPLFVHPGILARLALWLLDALRDRVEPTAPAYARSRHRKALPLVVACLNEKTGTFIVVGVTGAPDFDNVRKKYVLFLCSHPGKQWMLMMYTASSVWPSWTRRSGATREHGTARSIQACSRSTRRI